MSKNTGPVASVNVNLGMAGSGISIQGFTVNGEEYYCNAEHSLELIVGILAEQLPGPTSIDGRRLHLQIIASLPDSAATGDATLSPDSVEEPRKDALCSGCGGQMPWNPASSLCPSCNSART